MLPGARGVSGCPGTSKIDKGGWKTTAANNVRMVEDSDPSEMRAWVTPPGKISAPAGIPAESGENTE